jgi:lysozyme family protein
MRLTLENHIAAVMEKERGYVNHPDDKGGETNHGITIGQARKFGYKGEMKDLPLSTAALIYENIYWKEPKLDLIQQHSSTIAEEVFDSGVNCGQATAIGWLQTALNGLNKKQTLYPDVVSDGLMGEKTQAALRAFLNRRSLHGETVLLRALNCLQGAYYIKISQNGEKGNESFLFGWLKNRVA